jgi:hypothetical protein
MEAAARLSGGRTALYVLSILIVEAVKPGFRFREWARSVDTIKSLAWNSDYRA